MVIPKVAYVQCGPQYVLTAGKGRTSCGPLAYVLTKDKNVRPIIPSIHQGWSQKVLWEGANQKKKKNQFFRIFLLKKLFLLFFYEQKTT
jgi:hypothetical protein